MDFDFSNIINAISEFFNSISSFLDNNYKRLAAIAAILTIGTFLYRKAKAIKVPNSARKKDLRDKLVGFTDDKILSLIKSKRFIPTMGQSEPPHEDDVIFISPQRKPLIDIIINDIFDEDHLLDKKRYMILGGSGMGKSTFSVALLYHYLFKYRFKKSPYPIYIISLEKPNVLEQIKNLAYSDNVNQSIIILDALDENNEASKDISKFMEELDKVTNDFRFVVVTCRTQFFDNEESIPNKLKIHISGASKRTLEYDKIYVSPFNKKEAKRYLRRKFGFDFKSYFKALRISKKCWDVLSRPMILSFIDDLMELDQIDTFSRFGIYYKIIENWFVREREIKDIKETELFSFSKKLALYMYERWNESEELSISPEDYRDFTKQNGFNDSPYSFRARSLINRKTNGRIKFAHKSFWEFFLAINSFENPIKPLNVKGLTMESVFFQDICFYLNYGKRFKGVNYNQYQIMLSNVNPLLEFEHIDKLLKDMLSLGRDKNDFFVSHDSENNEEISYLFYDFLNELLEVALHLICLLNRSIFSVIKGDSLSNKKQVNHIRAKCFTFARSVVNSILDNFDKSCSSMVLPTLHIINQYNVDDLMDSLVHYKQDEIIRWPYPIIYPFYTDDNIVIPGIKITDMGFFPIDPVRSMYLLSDGVFLKNPFIFFIGNDDIDEIVSIIVRFSESVNRVFIDFVIINIVFEGHSLFYYIDDNTIDYSPKTIKNIINNMIKTTELDNSNNQLVQEWRKNRY